MHDPTPDLPPELAARRRELSQAVRRRAAQLRRRRALIVAGPCLAVIAAGFWAANRGGGTPTKLNVSASTSTTRATTVSTRVSTTTGRMSTTTMPRKPTAPTTAHAVPTTAGGSTRTTVSVLGNMTPTTTFDTSVCHNSFDPRCGFFTWQPPPNPNLPMSVRAAVSDVVPAVGEAVSVTIDVSDGDAAPVCVSANYAGRAVALTDSYGRAIPACGATFCPGPTRYGAWAPPAPAGGSRRAFGSFTPTAAGSAALSVLANSGTGCAYLPYGSAGSTAVTINTHSTPPTT